jgi:hypothetical protein|tara:strand:- start:2007 stop:2612 length:606 start_codon:yes stop_codon:yes gene_type:complete
MNSNRYFYENPGIYTSCKTKYNKEKDKMVDSTITDVFDCCLKNCEPTVKFCKYYCHTNKNHIHPLKYCLNNCDIHNKFCKQTCELSSKYTLTNSNIYYKCTEQYCDNMKDIKKCINKNKDKLKKCCMTNCTPQKNLNCNKYCDYFENYFKETKQKNTYQTQTQTQTQNIKNSNNKINIFLIIGIFFFPIIIIIIYLNTYKT